MNPQRAANAYFSALAAAGKKRRASPRDLEGPVQRAVLKAIKDAAPHVYVAHVPNGAKRNIAQRRLIKLNGVKAGFPDLVLILSSGEVAFIEVKTPGGKLRPEQKAFRDMCAQRYVKWAVIDDAKNIPDQLWAWGEDVRGAR
jgi:hypothetical protein